MRRLMKYFAVGLFFIFILNFNLHTSAQTTGDKQLYLDYNQPVKVRVADLLKRMTLDEKLIQMISRIDTAIPRLGIPRYHWGGEAGHCIIARANDASTIFPVGIAQAATWNRKLNRAIGDAMSTEAWPRFRAKLDKSTLTFWAPVVEMARDPRWGRTEECYGEDPYLTGQLSMEFVRGIQGDHPKYLKGIAAPKHFALNNEEWCRHNGSSNTDEQLLREYYLKPYQVLVQEGKAEQIMSSYNRLNGVPCSGNKWLLTDVLRNDWGFKGTVVSDCTALRDFYEGHKYVANVDEAIALALNSGMDIECGDCFKDHLADVVRKGMVSETVIDSAVSRILASRFKLGLMDPEDLVPFTKIPLSVVDGPVHRELARQASRESIVLLRNETNMLLANTNTNENNLQQHASSIRQLKNKLFSDEKSFLPLNRTKVKSVAVIGPGAKVCQLGGYSGGCSKAVSVFDGLVNKLGSDKVKFVQGTDVKIKLPLISSKYLIPADGKPGEHGLKGEYFKQLDCQGEPVIVRVDSLLNFNFGKGSPAPEMPKDYFSIRWTGKLIAPVSGDYYLGGEFDDAIRLYLDGKKIIDRTNNRNTSSDAVKIELEKGKQYDLKIEYNEQWYVSIMKLGGMAPNPDKFKEAIEAARNSDVAVVVVGTDETIEKEGIDRADMNLPGDQEDLVKAVFQANPNTIMVMQNGSSMSINWASEHIPAILEAWYGGEETGNAVADVIFGDYNPAARLPLTFYKSVDQLPSISDYDIRKGRTYMYPTYTNDKGQTVQVKSLYPFGYGLSYTQFAYSNLKISQGAIPANGKVKVSVDVRNTGKRSGDEVVQVYVTDEKASVVRPVKQLAAFERVPLNPNQVKTIEFEIPVKDLAYWDTQKKTFVVEPGKFIVTIGGSSDDVRQKGQFVVK